MSGTTRSSEGLDLRRRKLLFRCWHRGLREVDLIMGRFADATIEALPLDTLGSVPWWGDGNQVSLERIIVHVITDLSRHVGQADILREELDGAAGLTSDVSNLPESDYDWLAYVAKLTALAERY